MAEFQGWERRVLPQGELVAPQSGPSLAEAFGKGLMNLAEAGVQVADTVRKTDDWREEKEWEIKQPEAAAMVNQLQLDHLERSAERKASAAEGLSDYPEKIDLDIKRATDEALKDIADPRYQEYVRTRMDAFRVSAVGLGIQERTAATLEHEAAAFQTLIDGQAKLVAGDFANYHAAVELIEETIAANRHFGTDKKAQFNKLGKYALAKAGLDALIDRDLDAAEKTLQSGTLHGALTPADEQYYRDTIKSERTLREQEAAIVRQQQQEKLQADGAVAKERALKAARETGRYDPKDRELIIKGYPNDYPQILAGLEDERTIGHDTYSILRQTDADDVALLRRFEIDLSAKPRDKVLIARLLNIKEQRRLKQAALNSNAEAFVRKFVPEVQKGWDEVAKNPADLDLLRKTKELSRQAQLARGVKERNVRVLPDFMGDFFLQAATGPDGASAITQARDALGDDYKELLEQASRKEGPLVSVALMLDRPQQSRAQAKLLAVNGNGGIAALEAALPKKYSPQDILGRVRTELQDLAPSFAEQPGGLQVFGRIETSVYALTLDYIGTQGVESAPAAERAARDVATGFYQPRSFNGHAYRIPFGYDVGAIAHALPRYTTECIDYSKVDKPEHLKGLPADLLKLALVYNGYWTTRGDEQGLYLRMPSGAPVTIEEKPITVLWKDLLQLPQVPEQAEPSR